ncbi:MAG: hypothetical protein ACI4PO_11240 [Faecousia sp.]
MAGNGTIWAAIVCIGIIAFVISAVGVNTRQPLWEWAEATDLSSSVSFRNKTQNTPGGG